MRNCLILGSGRSGTSMVAGTLAPAGYFMGDQAYSARNSNPKGFFEDREVNDINEQLIAAVLPRRPAFLPRRLRRRIFKDRPMWGQRWLARLPVDTGLVPTPELTARMARIVQKTPFCLKDPRFSYTLPAWRPVLEDAVFVCVFRDPASTATSIVRECREIGYLRSLSMRFDHALEVWTLMYRHILDTHRHQGRWLFLHYNQVLTGPGLDRLEGFVEAPIDHDFPDPALRRSISEAPVPPETWQLYGRLCDLAGYAEQ